MKYINRAIITGNLGKDVELRKTKNGNTYCFFSVGTEGEFNSITKKADTTWVDCEAWGSVAEYFGKYGKKGCHVEIVGRLKENTRMIDGKKISTLVLKIDINGSHISPKNGQVSVADTKEDATYEGFDTGKSGSIDIGDSDLPF